MDMPEIDKAFFEHLMSEDELGVVIRAHIHVEASINEFIDGVLPFPEHLPRLQYEGRLRLACALGLNPDHFDALKLLGDIRNSFGHRIDANLTNAKVNELFSKLPKDVQELTLAAYKMTKGKTDPPQSIPEFSALSPKDRFTLISVILKSFVVVAAHQAKKIELAQMSSNA